MVCAQTRICSGKWDHKILWDTEIQTDPPIPVERPGIALINKKQRICRQVGFTVPTAIEWKWKKVKRTCHRAEKAVEDHEAYDDAARCWCSWNDTKSLKRRLGKLEIKERIETIQIIALLKSAWILSRVLEIKVYLLSLRFSENLLKMVRKTCKEKKYILLFNSLRVFHYEF